MVDIFTRNPSLGAPPVEIAREADNDDPIRTLMSEYPFASDADWRSLQGDSSLVSLPFIVVPKFALWGGGHIVFRMGGSYANTTANNATWNWNLVRADGTPINQPIQTAAILPHAAGNGSFQFWAEMWPFPFADHTWEQWIWWKMLVRPNVAGADQSFEGRSRCAQSFADDQRLNWTFQKTTVDGSVTFRHLVAQHFTPRSGS